MRRDPGGRGSGASSRNRAGSPEAWLGDPELRALLERNFEDEQRHITWLATRARPSEDEEPLANGES